MSEPAACTRDRRPFLPPPGEHARYLTVRPLGQGGMAETFVARSIEPSRGELVCLKRLRPVLAQDPAQRAHFVDEARVLSRLCHPNVLCVLDAGVDAEGPFLVTELLDGLDLRRLLAWTRQRSEPVPEPIALRIVHEIAEALEHAHARGVVHRDVTPANVLLGRDGRVVLIDFGIARSDAQTQRTRTGLVKGKAAYMAPEQALGATLDARTDLYALGVVLFEMLAGVRPHDGASDVETVTNAMRAQRRPLARPLAMPGLEALITSLLHPQGAQRPANAAQVLKALSGAPLAGVGELGAWVRRACDAAAVVTRTVETPNGPATRPSRRVVEEATATMPEQSIHTSVSPASVLEEAERAFFAAAQAPVSPIAPFAPIAPIAPGPRGAGVADATPVAVIHDWRAETDPPTTLDVPTEATLDATLVTPMFAAPPRERARRATARGHALDARPRPGPLGVPLGSVGALDLAMHPSRSPSRSPSTSPSAFPSTPHATRPRRWVRGLLTSAVLVGGLATGTLAAGLIMLALGCLH